VTPLADLASPALLVDTGRLDRNIADMAERMRGAGVALRPHVKTSKCLGVIRRQLAAGAAGATCATPAEVRLLQDAGVADVLWAYQPVGPATVAFTVAALRRGGLTVALDSYEAAEPLARAAADAGVRVPYLLECDTGLHRAGVDPDDAVRTAGRLAALPALEPRGVLTHEGHVAQRAGRAAIEEAGTAAAALLVQVAEALRGAGHPCPVVSVGSTPGATSAPYVPGVTEARPGTYVYYDANQVGLGGAEPGRCALTVLTRVISARRRGTAIIDAGLKAMSSDSLATAGGLGIVCDPYGAPAGDIAFGAANEEHGYLTGDGAARLGVGDLLRVIPNHACGTTNMWSAVHPVTDMTAAPPWPISARH
jgi:D-serine deaminase-like pyridoxal phosphate-dependent protein